MKNIILLPLDERPCNFDFPSKIFNGEKYTIIRPEHLGQKKTPASYEFIRDFLIANIEKVDAAVISIDTLLYGGLIPSRLHHLSEETVLAVTARWTILSRSTAIPFWRPWKLSPEGLPSRRLPLCQRRRRKSPSTCFCPRPPRIIGR